VSIEPGVLYVVATPIGNLQDMTYRGARVLADADWIAAEDTRHSRRLLDHLGVSTRTISLHQHNERARLAWLIDRLGAGESVALISDAGTPLISDPGYLLVREVRRRGHSVVPVPGPSAVIAALSVAGLPTDAFVFEGFVPRAPIRRRRWLEQRRTENRTLVMLESSHRILATVVDLAELFGNEREATLLRELTKLYESVVMDQLGALSDWLRQDTDRQRGEFVLVVAGSPEGASDVELSEGLRVYSVLRRELPLAQAVALAARISGAKKNKLYALALQRERGNRT